MTDLLSKDYDLVQAIEAMILFAELGDLRRFDLRMDTVLTLIDQMRELVQKEFYGV